MVDVFFLRCCEHHDFVLFDGFGCWQDLGKIEYQTSKNDENKHFVQKDVFIWVSPTILHITRSTTEPAVALKGALSCLM